METNNSNNMHSNGHGSNEGEIEEMDFSHSDFIEEDLATGLSSKDVKFDTIIGHIEDIVMEEPFQTIQNGFLEKYYKEFEDTEENKFCYTDIHKEYISLIESYLETELKKRLPEFCMLEFSQQLQSRKKELEGEIFEILLTFSDFMAFKEMLLDYKAEKEGNAIDLSGGLTVTPVQDKLNLDGASPFCITGKSLQGP
ncbi:ADP-ribosylation factor-like protein 2-binding protein [Plakobranchus ocellatus]|uniref:ADP-ribosylation factor-like protein 2-binding protein n=1 Tax=Plakobranchus ocellatus TaxID=259542 RepID=A0AAV3Z902_9GAST|nr:ADP-ribosylation factor-like protein 2-binding protein [Plakobranchus ocellatus]